jgi:hypothetical protein
VLYSNVEDFLAGSGSSSEEDVLDENEAGDEDSSFESQIVG